MAIKANDKAKIVYEINRCERENYRTPRYQKLCEALDLFEQLEVLIPELELKSVNPSVEWYTPPRWIELFRIFLGQIDCDPASCDLAQSWIWAKTYYRKEHNGLFNPWHGNVFCNPPYGKMTKPFLLWGLKQYSEGFIDEAIFLINRTGAGWFLDLENQFSAICKVKKRIAFVDPRGRVCDSPRYYNDLLYLGPRGALFSEVFSPYGKVVTHGA